MHGHGGDYKDLVVFLAAAGVMVPLVNRMKISPVLGFLAAGVVLGPGGLARFSDVAPWLSFFTISDPAQLAQLSELGVAFLLFMIGLELSWERLRAMRRLVFGLGLMQVVVSTLVLAGLFLLMGQTLVSAAVLGMGLALSSTAIVMPVLAESGRLKGTVGRSTFAILLAQDLSVAPILITVSVMAAVAQGGGTLDPAVLGRSLFTLVPAAVGLGLLVLLGRVVLRPMFRSVARARKADQGGEMFVAASLLVVITAGLAAQASGLSMSIGALVAGVLLAETEFRREVEVSIEPFKGLLLGVFFVGVGLGLDLGAIAAHPFLLFGLALAITVIKTGVIFGLARLWGLESRPALETALVLAPAGEFAFVVFATGMVEGIAPPGLTSTVALSATLSIFSIPMLAALGQRLSRVKATDLPTTPEGAAPPEQADGAVIIVGFGRVGRLIGELLKEHDQAFIALDTDAAAVAAGRRDGFDVFYGDAGRSEMLVHCGVRSTRALVVTMDAPTKVDEVVTTARALREDLILIARARDDQHAARLYGLGVTEAVPETTEASLQLAENTLVDLGVPMGLVLASIHEKRDQFRKTFQAAIPAGGHSRATRALRMSQINTGN
ncbi:cation:proton antiporter [Brevundimonas sp.]|jgi:monovalent cation:H+ antiporter-2, CPA2 family|uniref:cation:proton antiporter domain-containing protein n=1 Tax=Brevundimonas sp. TaxID=1871086 RepID=UPI0017FB04BB|nr:cation:proton antiporter [Brevundimonas sp.]MBA4808291.1 cation:proton antiporter [Brevundimonas sp.]